MPPQHVTIVGACFMDYVSYVDRFPKGGETLHANHFQRGFGGKGANQAVMIGRLGGRVRMVGKVGADGDGVSYLKNFETEGVETAFVQQVPKQATGLAKIVVDKSGENTIVICPNATNEVTKEFLQSVDWLKGTDMVVCQNEVPLESNLYAIEQASKAGKVTVYIPAPAPSPSQVKVLRQYMQYVSIFMPNQHEAGIMLGSVVKGVDEGKRAALALRKQLLKPDARVIITLGSQGAIVLDKNNTSAVHVSAANVPSDKVIDTTGAGDCFTGAFCYYLSIGDTLINAVKK
eukprot:gene20021-30813_t